jgi:hypothetical protein
MKKPNALQNIVSKSQVAAALNEAAAARSQLEAERRAHAETVKALERVRFTKPPKKITPRTSTAGTGDIVEVIFSDVHGNKHDPAAMAAFLGDLKSLNPDRLIIGGDFIDCGGFLAEHHTLGYVAETEDSYEDDVAVANSLLDQILAAARPSEVHYIEGNHEWRVERWALTQRLAHHKDTDLLRRTFCPEHVLRLKDRGIAYYHQGKTHGDCDTPGWVKIDKAFFVHKISNARDAAGQAMAKAAGNIVFFDTHRAQFKPMHLPGVGLISAWNPGCLCKRQPLYANTRPTEWTHGYLVRFISKKTGNFQMTNITINDGVSYASLLLKPKS